jgi:hypothetical protein
MALSGKSLRVYEARLEPTGGIAFAAAGDCALPAEPTSLAALQLPAPSFAVGCAGRSVHGLIRLKTEL